MVSLVILIIATLIVWQTWNENYGDSTIDLKANLIKAVNSMKTGALYSANCVQNACNLLTVSDWRILALGGVQSLFEGAMYVFVFLWTPALAEDAEVSSFT